MPAYVFKITGELPVSKDLDVSAKQIAQIKLLADACKGQVLGGEALALLESATNLHIDLRMVGRNAKVTLSNPPGTDEQA